MFTIIGGDGREYGPVSADQVRAWIAAGRADEGTKAKAAGADEWKSLGDFPEFFGDAQPPLVHESRADSNLAGRGARLGGFLIDQLFSVILILPGAMVLGPELVLQLARQEWPTDLDVGQAAGGIALLGLGLFIILVVQTWLLTVRGQTIGKKLVGIRIVRYRDGARPGFVRAVLLRTWVPALIRLVKVVGPMFLFVDIGFIFGPERRCLHDLIADTKVVVADNESRR